MVTSSLCPPESDLCTGFKNINVSEQGQLKCSYDNLYPQSEFTSRLNCETYALCDAGIYQVGLGDVAVHNDQGRLNYCMLYSFRVDCGNALQSKPIAYVALGR